MVWMDEKEKEVVEISITANIKIIDFVFICLLDLLDLNFTLRSLQVRYIIFSGYGHSDLCEAGFRVNRF